MWTAFMMMPICVCCLVSTHLGRDDFACCMRVLRSSRVAIQKLHDWPTHVVYAKGLPCLRCFDHFLTSISYVSQLGRREDRGSCVFHAPKSLPYIHLSIDAMPMARCQTLKCHHIHFLCLLECVEITHSLFRITAYSSISSNLESNATSSYDDIP